MTVEFRAYGMPSTQGSMKAIVAKSGRAVVIPCSKAKLKSWRSVIADAAQEAMDGRPLIDGPVSIRVRFLLGERPKSAIKKRAGIIRAWPHSKPDVDKLLRALCDAIKGIVYTDDARVVSLASTKEYGSPAGCEVSILALEEWEPEP